MLSFFLPEEVGRWSVPRFHSKNEAAEYFNLFVGDLCFWEKTVDDLPINDLGTPGSTSQVEPLLQEKDLRWRSAVDPFTGRIYYYHVITRFTQWEKPSEIRRWERQKKRERRRKDLAFFREMEANILARMKQQPHSVQGQRALVCDQDSSSETSSPVASPPLPVINTPNAKKRQGVSPTGPRKARKVTNEKEKLSHRVRTISGLDERVLNSLQENFGADYPVRSRRQANKRTQHKRTSSAARCKENGRPPKPDKLEPVQSLSSGAKGTRHDDRGRPSTTATGAPEVREETRGNPSTPQYHVRRNTGGTLFVQSTMTNPNVRATIKCVCGVYRAHIVHTELTGKQSSYCKRVSAGRIDEGVVETFRDKIRPRSRRSDSKMIPTVDEIENFYVDFFKRSQMEHDTIIMSLIYIERLIKETHGVLTPNVENWRSLLFSCMVLASKVWDDLSMWNIDFSNVTRGASSPSSILSMFTLQRINQLEAALLTALSFDVRVPASEYAKYYFLMRTMLLRSGLLAPAAAPLSREEAKMLEARTQRYQNGQVRRARSVDWSDWFNPVAVQCHTGHGPVLKDQVCLEQIISY